MRLGRGLVAKIVVGVVAVGLLGFGVYSVVRDRMAKEYLRAEAVAKEKYDGSGIKADITSVKVAFAVRKEGVYRLLGTGSDGKTEAKLIFKLPITAIE